MNNKSLTQNLKQYGLKSSDPEQLLKSINVLLFKYLTNSLKRAISKFNKNTRQQGGRTVLPLEYFGINSDNYYSLDKLPHNYNGHIMDQSTSTDIRPSLDMYSVSGQVGGSVTVTLKEFKKQVDIALTQLNAKDIKIQDSVLKCLKIKFEKTLNDIFLSMKRINTLNVGNDELNKVLQQKKYQKYL